MSKLINFLLIILAFFVIVIPNSFQVLTIILLTLVTIIIYLKNKRLYDISTVMIWLVLSVIFLFYIFMSVISFEDKMELLFKYIISPFYWITVFSYIRKEFSHDYIIKKLILFGFIANLSVLVLYILMSMGYVSFISLFILNPNINQNSGLGFTLHVYGSLVFFALSIIPSLFYIKKKIYKIIYLFSFIIVAVLSGRTALVLFVVLGLSLTVFYVKNFNFTPVNIFVTIFFIIALGYYSYDQYKQNFDVDIFDYITETHFQKIKESGGDERSIQTDQIYDQIIENPSGSGFVTLNIIRNDFKTYQYEVLILAVLMRFGILTFFLIIFSWGNSFINLYEKRLYKKEYRDFFILGFLAIIFSSFTNPYLESFCFQWMYFAPLILLKKDFRFRPL